VFEVDEYDDEAFLLKTVVIREEQGRLQVK